MITLTKGFAIVLLACLPVLTFAESGNAGPPAIKAALVTAVTAGQTIDEAVAAQVAAHPQQGPVIAQTALQLLERLPRTACATRAADGGIRLAVWPDFKACGDRIVRAAIAAGAEPTSLLHATAAGPARDTNAETDTSILLYLSQMLLRIGN